MQRDRLPHRQALILMAASGLLLTQHAALGQARPRSTVDALIQQMTLDEKLAMLHGAADPESLGQAGYLPGVPRLGVPPLRLTDGPAGVRVTHPATAMPAPVALAATFSPQLAHRFGQVIGREGRALGQDVLLSPMVNIVRVPQAGRNFETFSEDPLLAGRLVAEEVRGIQEEGLIATVKHFAANNFENGRQSVSADLDEQTLHEIYLPAFESAVRAGAGSVMASYNRVNGVYSAENPLLLTRILRGEWGFEGWVVSDWFGTHSTAPSLKAGLDLEMPGRAFGPGSPPSYFSDPLKAAVTSGEVSQEVLDRAVRRILAQMERFGLLDGSKPRPPLDPEADARVAREVAEAGAVLLRNERDTLPLRQEDLNSLLVVGPTARTPIIGGGGSARVTPLHSESPLEALNRAAGNAAQISYLPGLDLDGATVPASALSTPTATGKALPGLTRRPLSEQGEPLQDARLDFTGDQALPPLSSWRWSGTLTAPTTGDYEIKVQCAGGTADLTIDGKPFLALGGMFSANTSLLPTADGLQNGGAVLHLKAGEPHPFTVTAAARGGFPGMPPGATTPLQVRLAWLTPERRAEEVQSVVAAAQLAHTVVVFAYDEGSEGHDRTSLALPGDQNALIEAIARANPRTVVVLNTGSSVLMPWIEHTAAVLEAWYPGQEGAKATASLLLGEADPGGRLPETFPAREADLPTASAERYPGVNGHAAYSEGIFVGYRHDDARNVKPLFPFGHGLSYTRFRYSDLRVRPASGGLEVRFTVRNVGRRRGVETPQVYLGPPRPPLPAPMAVRKLVGFDRLVLAPGESREVTVNVGARELSYWSSAEHRWAIAPGSRPLYVGASSRDIRLQARTDIR